MFANFIYFIIALLILSLYEPPEAVAASQTKTIVVFVAALFLFWVYTRYQYRRLAVHAESETPLQLDHRYSQLSTQHSILALVLFTLDIWWLHLPAYLAPLPLFEILPVLQSLLLLLLFIVYLTIIWVNSYPAHRRIYKTEITLGTYVYSNIAFSVPILIPWTLLFAINDIIALLPFKLTRDILNSPAGQTGYFLIFLLIAAVFAPVLVQRFWRCSPMEDGQTRRRIEALCRRAGVGYADIVHWPIFGGRMITAGVMGLVSRFRYIMVTEALLEMLTADEIDQVIAHEIGHIKHKHLLLYLFFFIGFMLISYTAYPVAVMLLFFKGPFLSAVGLLDINPFTILPGLYAALMVIAIIVYFRYIFGYFMRNFERQADVFVFELFPTAWPLISTFDKIVASSGQPADKPNWHHFSIQQRVDYLRRCEKATTWIASHHRKVKKSLVAFIGGLILLALAAFQLNQMVFSQEGRHLNVDDLETYLDQKPTKTSDDAILYWIVGNVHFERGDQDRAISAYEASLFLDPENADTLNNLAWLLATSQPPETRDPQRALTLARKAIELKEAPHIWDTLAECLFISGRLEEAVEAAEKALLMNPEDRTLYEDQLARFKAELERQRGD
jgi:Zn-dependent protease with chaperone function